MNNIFKKDGYEKLFDLIIEELFNREILVEKGIILFEFYFNNIFLIFKLDKDSLKSKNEIRNIFFIYLKFWGGWINLFIIFIEEGLDWE